MRFTIRDLLWLTVVVALGVAWYFDRTWLWGEAYVNYLTAEQRDGELKDLIQGLETLPESQREKVREHLKKRRQDISTMGLNGTDPVAPADAALPSPSPPAPVPKNPSD